MVGDVTVFIPSELFQQVIWVNASDGYLAAPARTYANGDLDGFERMYMSMGTRIDDAVQVNTSVYWETAPWDDFISNIGVEIDLDLVDDGTLTDLSYTRIDAAFPWSEPPPTTTIPTTVTEAAASGNTKMVEVEKVEVKQTVRAEFTLEEDTTIDEAAFKDKLAASMGVDASNIEVTVGYKVKVSYGFAGEVSEADIKQAIAEVNSVDVSQVSVNITTARLLADSHQSPRRLAEITAAAEITVDDAAAAKSVEASASDGAVVQAALEAATGTSVAVTVAQEPRAIVELTAQAIVLADPGQEDSVPVLSSVVQDSAEELALPEVTVTSDETETETRTVQVEQETGTAAGVTSLTTQAAPAWALLFCAAVATAMSCE